MLTKPSKKKLCDKNCPYDCAECKNEKKWLKALDKAERKEMKRIGRDECKRGWYRE